LCAPCKPCDASGADYIAGEAAKGREAIEQARKLKPEVVVMDISMPVMDGIEATLDGGKSFLTMAL